ncbi:MAG: adenylyltransferase, partial [Cytophagia bacterium]|nr:adenylyltransferase [Cytophagia bacterium]
MISLIEAHGGRLKELIVSDSEKLSIKSNAINYPSITLNDRQLCDLELLMNGAFSPLDGFLNKKDYQSVVADMRLSDGTLWPMPVTLDILQKQHESIKDHSNIALRDEEGILLAVLDIEDIWEPDKTAEAKKVFGTVDTKHPAVDYLLNISGDIYV